MKRLCAISLLLCLMCAGSAFAAVPQQINYQGYLTNTSGNALDTTVAMTFKLYDDSTAGSLVWTETRPSVTVAEGLFNVRLGQITVLGDAVFNNPPVWLGITVGDNTEMTPRSRIVSVGYSYRVGTVDGASGGTISGDVNIVGKANIGLGNVNSGTYAFVAGQNDTASGDLSTVSGGSGNKASGYKATVGGGGANLAGGSFAAIGGGQGNKVSGQDATIGGGQGNTANEIQTTVAGGLSNTAFYHGSAVGGGQYNTAYGLYSTVGGGSYSAARGNYSTISGGGGATAVDSNSAKGNWSAIGGGSQNIASDDYATVGGGYTNEASAEYTAVGGGIDNTASGYTATVGGGSGNDATGGSSTVGGGVYNNATNAYATVGGGYVNTASGGYATVGGGLYNDASGSYTAVGGGRSNNATDDYATVGGGIYNEATGNYATVGGGYGNDSCAYAATIPGGSDNCASGSYSFAAGRGAKAYHNGAFVWADQTNAYFPSSAVNQFNVRASGGTRIYSNAGLTAGVTLAAGANAWVAVSDSTKKQNIRLVDTRQVLDRVSQLPIKQWSYKSQDPSIEHIGPMAQDFWKLFHLGEDSLGISTIDPDGIALAAIQELQKENEELRTAVRRYAEELNELRGLVEKMAAQSNQENPKAASAAFSRNTGEPTLKGITQ